MSSTGRQRGTATDQMDKRGTLDQEDTDELPHNALQHHWLVAISCHFRDCKVLLVARESDSCSRVSAL